MAILTGHPAPASLISQVVELAKGGDVNAATREARRALDDGYIHPYLFHLRALWLEAEGRFAEALRDLQCALGLAPADVGVLLAMGSVFLSLERPLDAREVFRRAASLRYDHPMPFIQLGIACDRVADIEGALAAYGAAVKLEPGNVVASARLAAIHAQQGAWTEARAFGKAALAADPAEPGAHVALALVEAEEGQLEEAERRLLDVIKRGPHVDHLYRAHMALGQVQEKQGRYEEAFASWTQGNDAAFQHYHAEGRAAPREATDLLRRIAEHYRKEPVWPRPAAPPVTGPARTHVFLLGFMRSGTTLLEQVLAAHPDLVALEEKEVLGAALAAFRPTPEGVAALRESSEEQLTPLRRSYWQAVASHGVDPRGKVFLDKMPLNTSRLPLIARLFPGAKVIFALRDPRDVILSCFRLGLRPDGIPPELLKIEQAGRYYDAHMRMAEVYCDKLPLNLLSLRHEDLLEDFEGKVREACDFIGIDLQPHMLEFQNAARKVATPSANQLKAGLNRTGLGRWRRYAEQMAPALPHLEPWVRRLGYEPS